MTEAPVGLADIQGAARRIAGRVRRTPTIRAAGLHAPAGGFDLWLKLENLQVTGSFKPRGATNCLLQSDPAQVARGIVTASGGNHGLAVAYAGRQAETRAVIYLPETTPAEKVEKLRRWGAETVIEGALWDDANQAARGYAERGGMAYIHPFADPRVIAGQGTVGLEFLEDAPELDLLVVAVGGGGLISGIATAAKAIAPGVRVVGVEPVGAPTLSRSLAAGELTRLSRIATAAGTLAPAQSAQINLDIMARTVDDMVLVDDGEMKAAARWLWFEFGIAAELAGAAAVAALIAGRVAAAPDATVGALVCGAGTDGIG